MNQLSKRPWFFPSMGAFLYLTGMNDEALHIIGGWWLDLGRWAQTAAVLALLALAGYFTSESVNRRRSAYRAALSAAEASRPESGTEQNQPAESTMRGTP